MPTLSRRTGFSGGQFQHFANSDIGLVQCRWGHVNENYSAITKAQALSLDFHFLIEQKAKSNSHLFMNFNGTAGIWRSDCIEGCRWLAYGHPGRGPGSELSRPDEGMEVRLFAGRGG